MVSVNDKNHADLQSRVIKYLEEKEFNISEETYHNGHIDPKTASLISLTFTPTALLVRSRADRLAFHKSQLMFFFEVKTSAHKSGNSAIEAVPLADHINLGRRGVKTLYVLRNSTGNEVGFWTTNPPVVRKIFLPNQRTSELTEWYSGWLEEYFPKAEIIRVDTVYGSMDPFAVISALQVSKLTPWQELIEQEMQRWVILGCEFPSPECNDPASLPIPLDTVVPHQPIVP